MGLLILLSLSLFHPSLPFPRSQPPGRRCSRRHGGDPPQGEGEGEGGGGGRGGGGAGGAHLLWAEGAIGGGAARRPGGGRGQL